MSTALLTPLLGALFVVGQDAKVAKPEPAKQLAELDFLVGRWAGGGDMPGGVKYTDEFLYSWNEHKTFLRSTYKLTVGTQVAWTDENVIGWDAELKKLVGFTFGMDGTIGRGVALDVKNNEWTFEGKSSGSSPMKEWRITLAKVDDDTITSTIFVKKGDQYEQVMKNTYKRAAKPKQ